MSLMLLKKKSHFMRKLFVPKYVKFQEDDSTLNEFQKSNEKAEESKCTASPLQELSDMNSHKKLRKNKSSIENIYVETEISDDMQSQQMPQRKRLTSRGRPPKNKMYNVQVSLEKTQYSIAVVILFKIIHLKNYFLYA